MPEFSELPQCDFEGCTARYDKTLSKESGFTGWKWSKDEPEDKDVPMHEHTLRRHGMYRITYTETERVNAVVKTSQLWYAGDDNLGNHVFSARPYAGTQTMPANSSLLLTMEKIPNDSVVYIGRKPGKPIPRDAPRSQHSDPRFPPRS